MAKNINTLRDLTDRLKNRATGLDDLVDCFQDSTPLDAVVAVSVLTATTAYIQELTAMILRELPAMGSANNCREFFAVNEPISEITDEEAEKPASNLPTWEQVLEIARDVVKAKRAERGDAFATEQEMEGILSDPGGWMDLWAKTVAESHGLDYEQLRWGTVAPSITSSLTKRYPVKEVDGEVKVLDVDNRWRNAKDYQQSLNEWPTVIAQYIGNEGRPALSNLVFKPDGCGCEIVGCGTLQFPLVIQYCEAHAKTEVA